MDDNYVLEICIDLVGFVCRTMLHDVLIHSYKLIIENFNVSSTKLMSMLNILDTFSMDITFGIRAGRFRSCLGPLNLINVEGPLGSGYSF